MMDAWYRLAWGTTMSRPVDYADIETRIAEWASKREDVRSVLILGSRGHNDSCVAQTSSDLDVLVVTSRPEWYRTSDTDWCWEIAPLIIAHHQEGQHMVFAPSDDFCVVFKPDLDVDFSIVPCSLVHREIRQVKWFIRFPRLFSNVTERSFRAKASTFRSGFRVLFEREFLTQEIRNSFGQISWSATLPDKTELLSVVDEFLVTTFKAARKVKAGKLFHAKWICDVTLKMQLIHLAEWHIRSQEKREESVRYRDLAVEQWADPRVRYELPRTYSQLDATNICGTLYASLNLFYWVIAETAKNLGYQDTLSTAVDRIEWLREYIELMG